MVASAPAVVQPDASIDISALLGALMRRAPRIVFLTGLLLVAAYAALMFMPRMYESTANLLIEPRTNAFFRATSDPTGSTYLIDEATVSSQVELIKSRATLFAAIEAAQLRDVPEFTVGGGLLSALGLGGGASGDERILNRMSENLVVVPERGSRLISISFRSRDPELAARVANAIAAVHINRRAGQQISDTLDATTWLDQEITRLREQVAEAERRVVEFRVENDLFVGANNTTLVDQRLSEFSSQITATAERRNSVETRAQLIRSLLDSGQSVSGVAEVQASPVVQQLSQEKARLQGERAQRMATLLSNHPTVRALDAQIAEIDNQIAAEGRRVADALDVQARLEADLERSLDEELTRLKIAAGSATREGVTLGELEREAAAQRELLNAYLIRYSEAAARTDTSSALPDVRLVSEAAPSQVPVSPKTVLILVAVLLGSVTLQVGGIIFSELLSGRALTERGSDRRATDIQAEAPADPDAFDEPPMPEETGTAAVEEPPLREEQVPPPPLRLQPGASAPEMLDVELESLAALLRAGTERRLVIASVSNGADSAAFAEKLTARVLRGGRSVAEIDAASRRLGNEPGLSDLCADEADFGDVVHRGENPHFGFIPWGQNAVLGRDTARLPTLVEALSDIYEAVIIVTGKVGVTSTLPLFAELGGACVLLTEDGTNATDAKEDIEALGFATVHIVSATTARAEVA